MWVYRNIFNLILEYNEYISTWSHVIQRNYGPEKYVCGKFLSNAIACIDPILCFVNKIHMMISSNRNISRVTGHLCGEFTGPRWRPVNSPHKGQWHRALMFSLICIRINGCVNSGEAGDLRRHRAHYDVTVMHIVYFKTVPGVFDPPLG